MRVESATSCWQLIPAGVPQGSVLGRLLFLIYTYDLPATIPKPVLRNQFADDTSLCSFAKSQKKCSEQLQAATTNAGKWLKEWRMSVNLSKTSVMSTGFRKGKEADLNISLYNAPLTQKDYQCCFGLRLSNDLRWNRHIDSVLF